MIRAFFILISCLCISEAVACTGVVLKTRDGSIINGRTVEFGIDLDMSLAVIPRGFNFTGTTPDGQGLSYKAKYASVGVYCFDQQILMDGVNEQGLSAAIFYFPGYAKYTPLTKENQKKALAPTEFVNWVLSQFATLEEVKDGVDSVVVVPTVDPEWGKQSPPMHYIVYDRSGKSLVIEPLEGRLKMFDNPIGVMTNSPSFDWHLQNLNNYINLTPVNASPMDLNGVKLTPFGQGSGMLGLPGDFTPPSRFVRAALFSAAAIASENVQDAVEKMFHVLNQFDIPLGSVCHKEGGKVHYDYTMLTTVKDSQALKYYYRSFQDQTIKFIDLKQFDLNAKKIRAMKIQGKEKGVDESSKLLSK
jgi:choloylglycine hydrolase